jgi:hypothetical protein
MAKCDAIELPIQPDTFWAYLAAFVDGEGSIAMCQNGPRMIISNTHRPTLEWFQQSLDCGYLAQNGKGTKPCYNLNFGSNAIRAILPKIIPYLKIKRQRAQILLDYLATVVPRGGQYHTSFQELRKRVGEQMRATEG